MENTAFSGISNPNNVSPISSNDECAQENNRNNIKRFRIKRRVRPKNYDTFKDTGPVKKTIGSLFGWVSESPIAKYFSKPQDNIQNNNLQTHKKKNSSFKNYIEKYSPFDPQNSHIQCLPPFGKEETPLAQEFDNVIPVILSIQSESDLSRNGSRPSDVHKSMSFYHSKVSDEDFNQTICHTDFQKGNDENLTTKKNKKKLENLEKWFRMKKEAMWSNKDRNDNNGLSSNRSETRIRIINEFLNRSKSEFSILKFSKKRKEQRTYSKPALNTIKRTISLISELLNSDCLSPNIFISKYEETSTPSPVSFASNDFKQRSYPAIPDMFKNELIDETRKDMEYNYSHKVEEIRCTTRQTMHLCNEILDAMTDLRGNFLMKQNDYINFNGRNNPRFSTPCSFNSFTNADFTSNPDNSEKNSKKEVHSGLKFTKCNHIPELSFKDNTSDFIPTLVPIQTIESLEPVYSGFTEVDDMNSQDYTENKDQKEPQIDLLEIKPLVENVKEVNTTADNVNVEKLTVEVGVECNENVIINQCNVKNAKIEKENEDNNCENNENENPVKENWQEISLKPEINAVKLINLNQKKLEKWMESEKIGVKLLKSRRRKHPTKCVLSSACHNAKRNTKQRCSNNHNKTILDDKSVNTNQVSDLESSCTNGTSEKALTDNSALDKKNVSSLETITKNETEKNDDVSASSTVEIKTDPETPKNNVAEDKITENITPETQNAPEITKTLEETKPEQAPVNNVKTEDSTEKKPAEIRKIEEGKKELLGNMEAQKITPNPVVTEVLTAKKEAGAGENIDKENVKKADNEEKKTEHIETNGLSKCELKVPIINKDTTPLLFYESLDAKIREVGTLIVKLKNGQQIVRKNNCLGNIKNLEMVEKACNNKSVNKNALMQILEEFDPLMSSQKRSPSPLKFNKKTETPKPYIYYRKTYLCDEEESVKGKALDEDDKLSYETVLKHLTEAVNSGLFFQNNKDAPMSEDPFSLKTIAFNWLMDMLKNIFTSTNVKYSSIENMKSPKRVVKKCLIRKRTVSPSPVHVYTSQNLNSIYRLSKKLKGTEQSFDYTNLLKNFDKNSSKHFPSSYSYNGFFDESYESMEDLENQSKKVRIQDTPGSFSPSKKIMKKKPILKTQKSLSKSSEGRKKKSVILPDDVIDEKSFSKRPVSPLLAEDVKKLFENVDSNIKIYTKLLNGYTKCSDPMLALSYQDPKQRMTPELECKSPKERKIDTIRMNQRGRISPLKSYKNNFLACKSGVVARNVIKHAKNKLSNPTSNSRSPCSSFTGYTSLRRKPSIDQKFSFRTTEKFEKTLAKAKRSKQKASRHLFLLKKQPFKKHVKTKKSYPKKYFAQDGHVNKFTKSFEVLPPCMKFKSKDVSKCFLTVRMISSERKFSSMLKKHKKPEISPVERYFLKDVQRPSNAFDAIKNLNVFSCKKVDKAVIRKIKRSCLKVNSSPNNSKNCSENPCSLEVTFDCGLENKNILQKLPENENSEEKENKTISGSLSTLSSLNPKETKDILDARKIKSEMTVSSSEKSVKSTKSQKATNANENMSVQKLNILRDEGESYKFSVSNMEENGWSLSKCYGSEEKEVSDLEEVVNAAEKEQALNKIEEWSLSSVGKFKRHFYESRRDGKMEGEENSMIDKRSEELLVSRLDNKNNVDAKMNERYREFIVKNSINNKNEDARFFLSDKKLSEKKEESDEDEKNEVAKKGRKARETIETADEEDIESIDTTSKVSSPFLAQKSRFTESENPKKTVTIFNTKQSEISTEETATPYAKIFESVSPIGTDKSVELPFNSLSTGSVYQEVESPLSSKTPQQEMYNTQIKEYTGRFNVIGFKNSIQEVKPYKEELKEEFNMFKRYLPTYNYSPEDKLLKSSPPPGYTKHYENFAYNNQNNENDNQANSVFQIFNQQQNNLDNSHFISNRFSMRN